MNIKTSSLPCAVNGVKRSGESSISLNTTTPLHLRSQTQWADA